MKIDRPALRHFGGKWQLASWILPFFPEHHTYVEPYGGSMALLLQKPKSPVEVYSDLNTGTVNFWKALQQHANDLISRIADSPCTVEEFWSCCNPADSPVEAARRYYIHSQLSFNGSGGRWDGGISPSKVALGRIDYHHLWAISHRIKDVQILTQDAIQTIKQFDTPDTLTYADPPYLHTVRGSKDNRTANPISSLPRRQYKHEMTDEGHEQLSEALSAVSGMAIVSGSPSGLYEQLYCGWECEVRVVKGVRYPYPEALWINAAALKVQTQLNLLNFSASA